MLKISSHGAISLKHKMLLSFLTTAIFQSTALASNPICANQFLLNSRSAEITPAVAAKSSEILALTQIEKLTLRQDITLPARELLLEKIKLLETRDPQLAAKVRKAKEKKDKNISLQVDYSTLPQHMVNFIEGAYFSIVGKRGTSEPFVSFSSLDPKTLQIEHTGDAFALQVRWTSEVNSPQRADAQIVDGKTVIVLQLPENLVSRKGLKELSPKYIYSLISGSHLNRYISSNQSEIMVLAGLLHEQSLVFDRPTQIEAKQLNQQLLSQESLAKQIKSLLFVAPTGSGKTKVLIDSLTQKMHNYLAQPMKDKKLFVVTTKTPDLTGELAKEISVQLQENLGRSKFRIIQWGGEFSESMTHAELIKFVDSSSKPVVLVTSYPTLGARSKGTQAQSELLNRSALLLIDEAHNATGEIFESFYQLAMKQALKDRETLTPQQSMSILGVTASPLTRTLRTSEIYDGVFWAGIDKVSQWTETVKKNRHDPRNQLEWLRIVEQFEVARDRGEINAADPIFYKPEQRGFGFASIFKRGNTGTQSSVNIERLREIWPDVQKLIADHGTGVIRTYPRDADVIASTLSELAGKNFVSLQGLSVERRSEVYAAFKNQTLYKGKTVDAIVGRIQEGMDFPKAGWYLSFKKYVKFPESLQDPGRVVRIAINKVPPRIIFFGEEVDKTSYQDVKELVMSHMGKLPRHLPEGRLYTGARVEGLRKNLELDINELNVSMEAFLRGQSALLAQLGPNGKFDAKILAQLSQLLLEVRAEASNREITSNINSFVAQVNAYSFFKGNLKDTWAYCDKMLNLARKGPEAIAKAKLSEQDKSLLLDPQQMAHIAEFRSMFSAIGPVPRALLLDLDLRPMNMTELAKSVNLFVELNKRSPLQMQSTQAGTLAHTVERIIQLSSDAFWRKLTLEARTTLKESFASNAEVRMEDIIERQVRENGKLPEFSFEVIDSPTRNAESFANNRMALELIANLKEGDIQVSKLSNEAQLALVQSDLFASLSSKTLHSLRRLKNELRIEAGDPYIHRLLEDGTLTLNNLSRLGDFRFLQVVEALAKNPHKDIAMAKEVLRKAEAILVDIGSRLE